MSRRLCNPMYSRKKSCSKQHSDSAGNIVLYYFCCICNTSPNFSSIRTLPNNVHCITTPILRLPAHTGQQTSFIQRISYIFLFMKDNVFGVQKQVNSINLLTHQRFPCSDMAGKDVFLGGGGWDPAADLVLQFDFRR